MLYEWKKKLYIRLFITREIGNFVKLRLLNRKVTGRLTYDGGCHLKPQFCCSTASGHRWRHWAHCCQSARCYWKTSVHRLIEVFIFLRGFPSENTHGTNVCNMLTTHCWNDPTMQCFKTLWWMWKLFQTWHRFNLAPTEDNSLRWKFGVIFFSFMTK